MLPIVQKVLKTIRYYNLLQKNDKVVVGVSGGADSICLLFILNEIKKIYNLKLYVAHVDHQTRRNSADDEKFVKDIALSLNIPYESTRIDIKKYAKENKLNIEDAGRRYRISFFADICKKYNCTKIALGHTSDDFVETVLMKFIKGSYDFGLSGIPIKREIDKIEIIRPLLHIKRKETEKYCKDRKIKYRYDITNKDTTYLRNKIRWKLLPQIYNINKNFQDAILKSYNVYSAENKYLEEIANDVYKTSCKKLKNKIFLDLKKFNEYNIAIQRRVIKKIIDECVGSPARISYENIEDIILLCKKEKGKKINLKYEILAEKGKDKIIFYGKKSTTTTETKSKK